MLDVSVIIVSYNTADLLVACLSSLYGDKEAALPPDSNPVAAPKEVIVVDNASSDGSAEAVKSRFPQAHFIANDTNRGFAAANNQGILAASSQYILLLNSDTVVLGNAIEKLAAFLDSHPSVAVAGAQLLNPDGSLQHSAFRFPGLLMTFFDFFPLNHRLFNSRLNGRYPASPGSRPFEIDHPLGACMMVRREAIDRVGLLDEQFFMYCEEIDWCMRIKKQGWRLFCVPEAKVVHYSGQSTKQMKGAMYAELYRSRGRFYRKHYSAPFRLLARWIIKLGLWRERRKAQDKFRDGLLSSAQLSEEMATFERAWKAVKDYA